MTAFDAAWRKEREDALASQLQMAYDMAAGKQKVQRFIHVADPIQIMNPYDANYTQPMFRDHISSTRLVNDEGEYIDAKEAFDDMMDDLKNLARPRKTISYQKDPKYARIFIPNPQSKMEYMEDFHLDEGKSEEWQQKNASEPMTAFDTAWDLMKMPIVPHSLKEEEPLHYSARFKDPTTEEIMDMKAQWINHQAGIMRMDEAAEIKAQIKHPHDDTYNLGDRATAYLGQLRDGQDDFSSYGTGVDEEYRRRGYATALYDMLARILHEEGGYELTPSAELNEMSRGFWDGMMENTARYKESWPVRNDL